MKNLLSRDIFREGVFARDHHKCVMCSSPAQDAHHILERRLFADGGYYLDNGASVCGPCHLRCEETLITPEELRNRIGITTPVIPPQLYGDREYDKWGNEVLPDGRRLRGELFNDESVRKILQAGGVLDRFVKYVGYGRTSHLPFSESVSADDRYISRMDILQNNEIVISEKRDGSNMSVYNDYVHMRSVTTCSHDFLARAKAEVSRWQYEVPEWWRVCGENLNVRHSIHYNDLKTWFEGFSIWNDQNFCLDYDETLEWFALLGVNPVPELYRGAYDQKVIDSLIKRPREKHEGFVIRTVKGFSFQDFRTHVGKYVRPNHNHCHFGSRINTTFETNDLMGE